MEPQHTLREEALLEQLEELTKKIIQLEGERNGLVQALRIVISQGQVDPIVDKQ